MRNLSILLFPHDRAAYESLLGLLETERRVCTIHPTDAGKSVIGIQV